MFFSVICSFNDFREIPISSRKCDFFQVPVIAENYFFVYLFFATELYSQRNLLCWTQFMATGPYNNSGRAGSPVVSLAALASAAFTLQTCRKITFSAKTGT